MGISQGRPDILPPSCLNIKRIAIIGAGPAGLGAAKYLVAENIFTSITIYEQQSEVGGVWNYTPIATENPIPIPQTTPHVPLEPAIWPPGASVPLFSNPMYDHLNTNIPKTLMQFSDQDFEAESTVFPSREDVQDYLVKYSKDLRDCIRFSMQVVDVKRRGEGWEVTSKSAITEESHKDKYDAIVVANGHYSVPYIPDVPSIKEFNATHPSILTHSKIYRSSAPFEGKKVIVVGSAASGLDIGTQISLVCKEPLLNSIRTPSPLKLGQEHKEEVPAIAEYLPSTRGVKFTDGRMENDIDAIVYCTGYLYSYPFLSTLEPELVDSGLRTKDIYRDIFSITHPTLAFVALGKKVFPLPLSEAQGAAIAKIWANKLVLPDVEVMREAERKLLQERGEAGFHVQGYPFDLEYINGLHEWVLSAKTVPGEGKEPPFWDKKAFWIRERYVEMRKKFIEMGGTARTIEELGFDYDHHDDH